MRTHVRDGNGEAVHALGLWQWGVAVRLAQNERRLHQRTASVLTRGLGSTTTLNFAVMKRLGVVDHDP